MRKGTSMNSALFIVILIISIVIGSIIGRAFSNTVPILNYGEKIGFGPATLDLKFFSVTFGFSENITLAGIIGLIIAIIAYRKL